MANIYDVLFILQFIVCIILIFIKLHNVMNSGKDYDWKYSVITFIAFFIFWAVGFVVITNQPMITIYTSLLNLENWFIGVYVLFFVIELFYIVRDTGTSLIGSHNSKEFYENENKRG
jgi:hypothetical protein